MPKKIPFESRYTIDRDTGCWNWIGNGSRGYHVARLNGVMMAAHRASYIRSVGPVPEGMQLDHLCRNRACVNPKHLEPVTPKENTRRSSLRKLSLEAIAEMRRRYAAGEMQKPLAREFGVSVGHLSEVVRGKYWDDAPGDISAPGFNRPRRGRRVLTDQQVADIASRKRSGEKTIALAREYGIDKSSITRSLRRNGEVA